MDGKSRIEAVVLVEVDKVGRGQRDHLRAPSREEGAGAFRGHDGASEAGEALHLLGLAHLQPCTQDVQRVEDGDGAGSAHGAADGMDQRIVAEQLVHLHGGARVSPTTKKKASLSQPPRPLRRTMLQGP